MTLINIILATSVVGLIGVFGAYSLIKIFVKNHARLMLLVSFAAGAMVSVSFFELIPEALKTDISVSTIMGFVVAGLVLFLLIEKGNLYYHCHKEDCQKHNARNELVIIGDLVHNLLDGIAIASSFLAGNVVGVLTTAAIIIHEIPKEVGGIGILIHGGFSRLKALVYNLITAVLAIIGGIVAYFTLDHFRTFIPFVLAITAGGFIYIATVDLLPELHHESDTRAKISWHSFFFVFGIFILWILTKFISE